MKRLALVVLLLTAVAVGVFLALHRPGAQASPGAIITVDSTADTNARDRGLTLREAMLLATGGLQVGDLSSGEADNISGTPGSSSADTIVFDPTVFPPSSPATIALSSELPILSTSDDTVDGSSAGVIVDGVNKDFYCFIITSDGNTIKGLEIYNCEYGVYMHSGAQSNIIGGSSLGERNVISGNDSFFTAGVAIGGAGTSGNVVKGNYIGTNASGTAAVPNWAGVGIGDGAQDNIIGGGSPGEGNVIAFSTEMGVWVLDGSTGNTISGNSIHSNIGKGIENEGGGNTELAPPIVDSATGSASGHTNPKCYPCTVEVFSDDEDEGRIYHGSTITRDDATGTWTYSGTVTDPYVTATITDADGNTSEFSAPVAVTEETSTPTPSPTPTPTATATPTPTPTATATPTPPAGPTRTLVWGLGWHNATWSGASTPEEAFACAAGKYAAAYRFTDAGLERYFPGRAEISNMTDLGQYNAFLILITQPVTCAMPVTAASGASRTLQWGAGWHNEGWSGPDGTTPENAFACAQGSYGAAYRLVSGSWERYFPGRPEISDMGPLNKYDAFLVLVTAPVSCAMPIAP